METPVIFDNDLLENDEIEDFTDETPSLQINVDIDTKSEDEKDKEDQNRLEKDFDIQF